MSTTPRRKYAPRLPPEERRTQLLDAALEIVAEEGLPGVSIESIARRAGVTRPVVYSVYADLDELLGALLQREEQRAFAQVASAMPLDPDATAGKTPDDIAVDGIATFLRAVQANPLTWRMILLPVDGTPPLLRQRVEQTRGFLLTQMQPLIAWGIEQRGGPHGVETELLARTILTLAEEAGRLALTQPEEFTIERLTAFARGMIEAVGARPS